MNWRAFTWVICLSLSLTLAGQFTGPAGTAAAGAAHVLVDEAGGHQAHPATASQVPADHAVLGCKNMAHHGSSCSLDAMSEMRLPDAAVPIANPVAWKPVNQRLHATAAERLLRPPIPAS